MCIRDSIPSAPARGKQPRATYQGSATDALAKEYAKFREEFEETRGHARGSLAAFVRERFAGASENL
eukprot:9477204-Alexandrium_andersonii.AAC.1